MFEDIPRKIFQMPSAIALIISNLVPLFGVLFLGWNSAEVLLLFWSESAAIGFYNVLKMIKAKGKPQGLEINGKKVVVKNKGDLMKLKHFMVTFFIIHYGGFMFGHLIFLSIFLIRGGFFSFLAALPAVIFGTLGFFISHGISYYTNYLRGKEYEKADIGKLFFSPYARIVPMHIAIILGFISGAQVLILVIVKTIFDLFLHFAEHNKFQKVNGRSK